MSGTKHEYRSWLRPFFILLGIDPGTTTLGVAQLKIDCDTLEILSTRAETFIANKLAGYHNHVSETHGDMQARVRAHRDNLGRLFDTSKPSFVAAESSFYKRSRPNAYQGLLYSVANVREALWGYDPTMSLILIEPSVAKNAVGAGGRADKDEVQRKILKMEDFLHFEPNENQTGLRDLDEHSNDAIAIAYAAYLDLFKGQINADRFSIPRTHRR